jgi:hypothetical protein
MRLTDTQRDTLREYLDQAGLTFKPLQDEMVDHFACDLEDRMSNGHSFQEAWHLSMGGIPKDHFETIQTQVMETINKRFSWSQGLSFLALALLFISMLFKTFHLQFAGEVLLLSFVAMAAALVTASVSGAVNTRQKPGSQRLLAVVAGVILLLVSYSFKMLHLPGGDQLVTLAVSTLVLSLLLNTIAVYQKGRSPGNLLTFLHEKHTPGIERFLLLLLVPLAVYKAISVIAGSGDFVGNMVLLVVILAGGLQFFALTWRVMENAPVKRSIPALIATMVSVVLLCLPFLGQLLAVEVRIVMIMVFSTVSAWLAYSMEAQPKRLTSLVLVILMPLVFVTWGFLRLGVLATSFAGLIFNLPILAVAVAGLFLSNRHGTVRAYLIVMIASYLFEYIT